MRFFFFERLTVLECLVGEQTKYHTLFNLMEFINKGDVWVSRIRPDKASFCDRDTLGPEFDSPGEHYCSHTRVPLHTDSSHDVDTTHQHLHCTYSPNILHSRLSTGA